MAIVLWILGNAMVKMIVPMEVTKRNLYAKKGSVLPVNSGLYSVELQFFFSTKILSWKPIGTYNLLFVIQANFSQIKGTHLQVSMADQKN